MKPATEAPVNGGRNYDGPKVRRNCLSKIWLYAGKSEDPTVLVAQSTDAIRRIRRAAVTIRWCRQSAGKAERYDRVISNLKFEISDLKSNFKRSESSETTRRALT